MLRRGPVLMCGQGGLGWASTGAGGEEMLEGEYPRRIGQGGQHPRRRGRHPSFYSRTQGRRHYYDQLHHLHHLGKAWPRCHRQGRARVLLSLRPVNEMGRRAPGMRAPRNTNQFLMGEKYQMMHLRSDSVGTDSGGSDGEMDPLGMDSYLGVLENARGALLDGPAAPSPPAQPSPGRPSRPCLEGAHQEDSLQYFPSENDVMESETFMERDFQEFCSSIF